MSIFDFGKKDASELLSKKQDKYSKEDLATLMKEASKRGAVHAYLHFDAHGVSKEAVENALLQFVSTLTSKEKGVLYAVGEIESAVEEGNLHSGYSKVEILTDNFLTIFRLCQKYAPIGVEILQPSEFKFDIQQAQSILLDAAGNTQEYVTYIYKNVLKGEEKAKYDEQINRKVEMGKKLKEKSEKK